MQCSAAGQAVLADQPDPAATGPGQLGGLIVGRLELAVQDLPEQPCRARQITDVVFDELEAGGRPGSGSSRGAGPRGEPASWAIWMTMP